MKDPRVIVPVGRTEDGQVIYWAVLGVQVVRISPPWSNRRQSVGVAHSPCSFYTSP